MTASPHESGRTYLDLFAGGHSQLSDLCSLCLSDVVAIAEVAAGRPLNWAPAFRQGLNEPTEDHQP
jgi:hypothetical protein